MPPVPLEYAARPRHRLLRHWRRHLALLLALVGAIAYHHRAELSLRLRRVYWSRQCLACTIPSNTTLIERDPSRAAALLRSNHDYTPWVPHSDGIGTLAAYYPRCWQEYSAIKPSSPYARGQFLINPFSPPPVIFLHERQTPSGHSRLVVVFGESTDAGNLDQSSDYLVLTLPSLLTSAPGREISPRLNYSRRPTYIALHPGTPDPHDPTHFTIPFDVPNDAQTPRTGIIDVYLRDDYTLAFTIRDPATTQPADPTILSDYNLPTE